MSKNLIRKGLGLLATASLAIAGLVGISAPAQAAGGLTVMPVSGTSTGMISGEWMKLKVVTNAGTPALTTASELIWTISNPEEVDFDFKWGNDVSLSEVFTSSEDEIVVIPKKTDDDNFPYLDPSDATGVSAAAGKNEIWVKVAAGVAVSSITVAAHIENDGGDVLSDGDIYSSTPVALNFVKVADVATTITFTPIVKNDTTVTANFELVGINNQLLDNDQFLVHFETSRSLELDSAEVDVIRKPAAWSATKKFEVVTGTLTALDPDVVRGVQAQVWFKSGGFADVSNDTSASAALTTLGGAKIGALRVAPVGSVKAANIVASGVVSATAAEDGSVLRNSSFQVKAVVKDGGLATSKPVSGVSVVATFTKTAGATALSSSEKITINGTTYSTNATLAAGKVTLTTDAKGTVLLSVTTEGFETDDVITFSFKTDGLAAATLVVTSEDAEYTGTVINLSDDYVASTVDGTAVPVTVEVRDQFGGVPANGKYLVGASLVSGGSSQATPSTAASSSSASVVNGSATLSVLDNGTGVGINRYNMDVYEIAFPTPGSVDEMDDLYINIVAAGDLVPGEFVMEDFDVDGADGTPPAKNAAGVYQVTSAKPELAKTEFGTAWEHRILETIPEVDIDTYNGEFYLEMAVESKGSDTLSIVEMEGQKVSISAPGMQIYDWDRGYFAVGSMDVYTDMDGLFGVSFFSNKSGKQTITLTAGGVTQKVEVTFNDPADTDGTTITLSAPKSQKAGRALVVTATLTDKYGNLVSAQAGAGQEYVAFAYDGPGLVLTEPTDFVAGKATLRVLLNTGDFGPAVVTASYLDGDDTITASSATWIGPVANAVAGAKKGVVLVEAYRAKGQQVTVRVGKTVVARFTADKVNDVYRVTGVKKGDRKVTVSISGPGQDFRGTVAVK